MNHSKRECAPINQDNCLSDQDALAFIERAKQDPVDFIYKASKKIELMADLKEAICSLYFPERDKDLFVGGSLVDAILGKKELGPHLTLIFCWDALCVKRTRELSSNSSMIPFLGMTAIYLMCHIGSMSSINSVALINDFCFEKALTCEEHEDFFIFELAVLFLTQKDTLPEGFDFVEKVINALKYEAFLGGAQFQGGSLLVYKLAEDLNNFVRKESAEAISNKFFPEFEYSSLIFRIRFLAYSYRKQNHPDRMGIDFIGSLTSVVLQSLPEGQDAFFILKKYFCFSATHWYAAMHYFLDESLEVKPTTESFQSIEYQRAHIKVVALLLKLLDVQVEKSHEYDAHLSLLVKYSQTLLKFEQLDNNEGEKAEDRFCYQFIVDHLFRHEKLINQMKDDELSRAVNFFNLSYRSRTGIKAYTPSAYFFFISEKLFGKQAQSCSFNSEWLKANFDEIDPEIRVRALWGLTGLLAWNNFDRTDDFSYTFSLVCSLFESLDSSHFRLLANFYGDKIYFRVLYSLSHATQQRDATLFVQFFKLIKLMCEQKADSEEYAQRFLLDIFNHYKNNSNKLSLLISSLFSVFESDEHTVIQSLLKNVESNIFWAEFLGASIEQQREISEANRQKGIDSTRVLIHQSVDPPRYATLLVHQLGLHLIDGEPEKKVSIKILINNIACIVKQFNPKKNADDPSWINFITSLAMMIMRAEKLDSVFSILRDSFSFSKDHIEVVCDCLVNKPEFINGRESHVELIHLEKIFFLLELIRLNAQTGNSYDEQLQLLIILTKQMCEADFLSKIDFSTNNKFDIRNLNPFRLSKLYHFNLKNILRYEAVVKEIDEEHLRRLGTLLNPRKLLCDCSPSVFFFFVSEQLFGQEHQSRSFNSEWFTIDLSEITSETRTQAFIHLNRLLAQRDFKKSIDFCNTFVFACRLLRSLSSQELASFMNHECREITQLVQRIETISKKRDSNALKEVFKLGKFFYQVGLDEGEPRLENAGKRCLLKGTPGDKRSAKRLHRLVKGSDHSLDYLSEGAKFKWKANNVYKHLPPSQPSNSFSSYYLTFAHAFIVQAQSGYLDQFDYSLLIEAWNECHDEETFESLDSFLNRLGDFDDLEDHDQAYLVKLARVFQHKENDLFEAGFASKHPYDNWGKVLNNISELNLSQNIGYYALRQAPDTYLRCLLNTSMVKYAPLHSNFYLDMDDLKEDPSVQIASFLRSLNFDVEVAERSIFGFNFFRWKGIHVHQGKEIASYFKEHYHRIYRDYVNAQKASAFETLEQDLGVEAWCMKHFYWVPGVKSLIMKQYLTSSASTANKRRAVKSFCDWLEREGLPKVYQISKESDLLSTYLKLTAMSKALGMQSIKFSKDGSGYSMTSEATRRYKVQRRCLNIYKESRKILSESKSNNDSTHEERPSKTLNIMKSVASNIIEEVEEDYSERTLFAAVKGA